MYTVHVYLYTVDSYSLQQSYQIAEISKHGYNNLPIVDVSIALLLTY